MMDLIRVDCMEGGPVYLPVAQIHCVVPHPQNAEWTLVSWSEGGQCSHCTINIDVDEFAQQLERSCPLVRLHTVA